MSFIQLNLAPGLLIAFLIFVVLVVFLEKKFFNFVRTYWFYRRSFFSYISTFLFILGLFGLLLSLLDARGPEEKIKTEVPQDRTIILIDTSASMLAEDVKPSRLQKAILIAKHFARKAAGQQLSIVAFAEVQKKIVPFTNDLDLIDARLDSLKNLRNHYGSSALSVAIQESVQYFRDSGQGVSGNILVLTDGEETAEGIDLKIPPEIHVALVGVGSSMGGRIPLDDGRGFRFGYKKDRGQDVITKLEEKYFKALSSEIPSSQYWIANSYSLPSEEILEFFQGEQKKGNQQQDMVYRPVLMEWIVVPAIILLVISYFFKAVRIFALSLVFCVLPLQAEDAPKITPEIEEKISALRAGKLTSSQKVKLADDLQKAGARDEAVVLYSENLPKKIDPTLPPEAYLNYGTALLEKGEAEEGLRLYRSLDEAIPDSPQNKKIREMMEKNIASFFQQQEQKKKEKKEQDQKQDKKEGESSSGQGQNSQGGKDQSEMKKDSQSNENKNDQKKDDQKKNDGEEKPEDEEKKNPEDKGEKKPETPKPLPQKVPAKLKQLMNDDRQLQMKMIENGTRDLNRRKSRKSKDW